MTDLEEEARDAYYEECGEAVRKGEDPESLALADAHQGRMKLGSRCANCRFATSIIAYAPNGRPFVDGWDCALDERNTTEKPCKSFVKKQAEGANK